ncbi:PIN domain-containing protein [Cellulomonas sp. Sa3CUA2]|uniref:Ribonuclease VapC n=1 Tax=Cellulomonas avistercoris TaxID=2762242 RepID=A0ABR8QF92_9CELL|nr:PIN domain-containing protein [Cellulomonas avistercoris]
MLDVNVLLALAADAHVHHGAAHRWFAGVTSWATTPVTESAFVRLLSNPAVAGRAILPVEAVAALRQMRTVPGHRFVPDDASFVDATIDLTRMVGPRQVTDYHLVELAKRTGSTLATLDAKLRRSLHPADTHLVSIVPAA